MGRDYIISTKWGRVESAQEMLPKSYETKFKIQVLKCTAVCQNYLEAQVLPSTVLYGHSSMTS